MTSRLVLNKMRPSSVIGSIGDTRSLSITEILRIYVVDTIQRGYSPSFHS
ncbi:MAG: hypothetical protein RBG13Loki_0762 [Promethearchaeota archaeon CR_4]|nr:MAG: hypothetical protein RBG13Loki_0762 [Candidatus Lokiarchaeota archaeon CR_4]